MVVVVVEDASGVVGGAARIEDCLGVGTNIPVFSRFVAVAVVSVASAGAGLVNQLRTLYGGGCVGGVRIKEIFFFIRLFVCRSTKWR